MVCVNDLVVEQRLRRDLTRRAFKLAVEMFGSENVDRSDMETTTFSMFRGGAIRFKEAYLGVGVVNVKSEDYFVRARKFSERYELEVTGRIDSIIITKEYS